MKQFLFFNKWFKKSKKSIYYISKYKCRSFIFERYKSCKLRNILGKFTSFFIIDFLKRVQTSGIKKAQFSSCMLNSDSCFFSHSFGLKGRECLLRTICETAESPLRHNGLMGDILHIIFTWVLFNIILLYWEICAYT